MGLEGVEIIVEIEEAFDITLDDRRSSKTWGYTE
jgi:acyl carrier protein